MPFIVKRWGFYFPGVCILLFITLGLGYDSLTPIFENSDETLHYPYVKHLADGRGLPLAIPGQRWNQEGTQHPLYYAIVAATTFWINTDNLTEHLQLNPHWRFTEVRTLINDNQNRVLHGPMDAWPYQRAALAIHLGRWWSLFFGAVTVACTFLLARHLFPQNLPLVITATALTAFNPQFIRVSATVSNDSLSAALTTLAVLLAFKFTDPKQSTHQSTNSSFTIHHSQFPNKPYLFPILLGLLTALALLTKLSALTTLFLVAFIVFWRLFFLGELHQSPLKIVTRWLTIIIAITIALTGWWFWRNYQLYGEWLATETHLNLAGRGDLLLGDIWRLRHEAERAFWATFGWGQIRPPEWVYQLFFWFSRLGLLGLALGIIAKLVQGPKRRPLPLNVRLIQIDRLVILLLWAGMSLFLYVRWVMDVGSVSHTRLMFPALAAIALLLALGWHVFIPARWAGWFSGVVVALLLTLNVYALGWLIGPAFTPPANASAGQPVNIMFPNRLQLTGSQLEAPTAPTTGQPQLKTGETILVHADWQVLAPMEKNYSLAISLVDAGGTPLAQRETYPGLGLRPTRYLSPSDSFTDIYPLTLSENPHTTPTIAQIAITLFDLDSETRAGFPALDSSGNEITPFVGHIKLVPATPPEYQPQYAAQVTFAEAIALTGYDLDVETPRLTLYWHSLAPVKYDGVVFIHLLDGSGQVIAQADGPPAGNTYPTHWWSPGETIADTHILPVEPEFTTLRFGLYNPDTNQRVPITGSNLPLQDHSVEIEWK